MRIRHQGNGDLQGCGEDSSASARPWGSQACLRCVGITPQETRQLIARSSEEAKTSRSGEYDLHTQSLEARVLHLLHLHTPQRNAPHTDRWRVTDAERMKQACPFPLGTAVANSAVSSLLILQSYPKTLQEPIILIPDVDDVAWVWQLIEIVNHVVDGIGMRYLVWIA